MFVAPTDGSLRAAAAVLRPDAASRTWSLPYASLLSDSSNQGAYPGAMLVYAAVPTTGVAKSDAVAYADWIRFAATTGQQPGTGVGQLPDGYLPLTAANGLGAQAEYSVRAADAIAAQDGTTPPLKAPAGTGGTPSPTPTPNGNNGNPGGSPGGSPAPGGTPGPGSGGSTPGPSGSPAPVSLGDTVAVSAGVTGLILPTLLGVAAVFGLLVPITLLRTRSRRLR